MTPRASWLPVIPRGRARRLGAGWQPAVPRGRVRRFGGRSTKSTLAGPGQLFPLFAWAPLNDPLRGKGRAHGQQQKLGLKTPADHPNPYLVNTHKTDTIFYLFVCLRYPVSNYTDNPFSPNPTLG